MRLGIVMMGTGAYAAANAGVLRALEERGIEPYAVCGMQFGAWIAALHLAGRTPQEIGKGIEQAQRYGARLLHPCFRAERVLSGTRCALCDGAAVSRLLLMNGGEKPLGLYSRRAIFPCRAANGGRRIVFSTIAYMQGSGVMLTMQATAAFAARAQMSCPPFLTPVLHMGVSLMPEENPAFAAGQLLRMGADRVLIAYPCPSDAHEADGLELAYGGCFAAGDDALPEEAYLMRIVMPAHIGALGFKQMARLEQAGYEAARAQMDHALESMGVCMCRILPFEKRAQSVMSRIGR